MTHDESSKALNEEVQILREIEKRTGLTFLRLGAIDSRDQYITDKVLPVVADWVYRAQCSESRSSIYTLFGSSRATKRYVERLLKWYEQETDPLAEDMVAQVLGRYCPRTHALELLRIVKDKYRSSSYYAILVRLAILEPTAEEAAALVVGDLYSREDLKPFEIQHISKLKNGSVMKWFEQRKDASNTTVRAIARRLFPTPIVNSALRKASDPRASHRELFSTEIDVDQAPTLLRELAVQCKLSIPSEIADGKYLNALKVDRWYCTEVPDVKGKQYKLCFRMEDIDVVEVFLG